MENISIYDSARKQMKIAFDMIDELRGKEDIYEYMSVPQRVLEVNIPVKMDDGRIRIFKGYRSQHNDSRGPFKGGIRFHQMVNKDEVMALSIWMSFKGAILDLPIGGGKGGIIVDPKGLSEGELESLSRGYVRQIYKYIGPNLDVPAPDVNTNPKIMGWMMDEFSRLVGVYSPGAFTGKSLTTGGSLVRDRSTALGGVFVLLSYLEYKNQDIKGKKIIVQGAGNAGLTVARMLEEKGAIIVGISDSKGGIYDIDGIDIGMIDNLKKSNKSVLEYGKGVVVTNEEILEKSADILIPAALENQITILNAEKIQAGLIMELANGPTSPDADSILNNRGVVVIPDILANSGGVMVSYFEMVQNNTNFYRKEDEIINMLKEKMAKATLDIYTLSQNRSISLRASAYIIGLRRIYESMRDRGMF